jgi:microsomal dipeptidase-like Zn-dependent dipeptidase
VHRRRFIGTLAGGGIFTAFGDLACGANKEASFPDAGVAAEPLLVADPHAHPYELFVSQSYDSATPTIKIMKEVGMTLCSFAAVGDRVRYPGRHGMPFNDTQEQLRNMRRLEDDGELRLVLKFTDIQSVISSGKVLGGLMAIEGGDALEGKLQNLEAFHDYGVRLMTVMHDHDNEIGYNQRSASDGPLTSFGIQVIERMNKLGMVVDVAHAKTGTLKGIAQVCAGPLIDSHTSLLHPGEGRSGMRRLRTWDEMEVIAKTGGIVCTWPLAYVGSHSQRTTLEDWAREVVQMKTRLGIEHCGLGTDGGGGLPRLVKGWDSIASLPKLMEAMKVAGLSNRDIAAFAGGNLVRILARCLA